MTNGVGQVAGVAYSGLGLGILAGVSMGTMRMIERGYDRGYPRRKRRESKLTSTQYRRRGTPQPYYEPPYKPRTYRPRYGYWR